MDAQPIQTNVIEQAKFQTTDQTVPEDALVGAVDLPLVASGKFSMAQGNLDAMALLKNPVLIGNFTWATSDLTGAVLQKIQIPEVFNLFDSFQKQILGIYAYFKPELEFDFKLTSSPFHVGKLIVFYDPFEQMADTPDYESTTKFVNRVAATGQPHLFLDASEANTGVLKVPFQHPQAFLTTNSAEGIDIMGTLRVMVFNPLRVVTPTTPSVDFQVFLRCPNLELRVPVAPHAPIIPSFIGNAWDEDIEAKQLNEQIGNSELATAAARATFDEPSPAELREAERQARSEQYAKREEARNTEERSSGFGDLIGGTIGAFAHLATGNYSGFFKSGGKAQAGLGRLLSGNLDKPTYLEAGARNAIQPIAPLAHGKGVDNSVRLGISQFGAYTTDLLTDVSIDNFSAAAIARRKMLVDTFEWTTTDEPNTILYNIPVLPSYCTFGAAGTLPDNGFVYSNPTFLSYISAAFAQWRGSIAYRFDVVGSPLHNGLLGVFFMPNSAFSTVPTGLQQMTNLPFATLEVSKTNRTLEVVVPYMSSTERKVWVDWPHVSSRNRYIDNEILGILQVRVMNKLACPNVTTSIQVNVFQGAGEDMEFHVPIKQIQTRFKRAQGNNTPPGPFVGNSLDLPTRSGGDPPPLYLGKGGGTVVATDPYAEQTDDIRDLMRRYVFKQRVFQRVEPIGVQETPDADGIRDWISPDDIEANYPKIFREGTDTYSVSPMQDVVLSWYTPPQDPPRWMNNWDNGFGTNVYMTYFARLFAMWSGSVRYKFQPYSDRTKAITAMATMNPSGKYSAPELNYYHFLPIHNTTMPTVVTSLAQQACVEVECPYYSAYGKLITETNAAALFPYLENSATLDFTLSGKTEHFDPITRGTVQHWGMYVDTFIAAGDDMTFSYLVAPPAVYTALNIPVPS